MARKSAFDRLAKTAARLDALEKKSGALASRMLRTTNPAKLETQSKAGRALDRQIKATAKRFREIERSLVRTTPGERKRAAEARRQELETHLRELKEEEAFRVRNLIAQTFTIRGSYRSRKNHGVSLEVRLTYVGLPLDEVKDARKIRDAVRSLANGKAPEGGDWEVSTVEYGPTVQSRTVRGEGDFQKLANAINDPDFTLTVGENDR